ncbi:DUF6415 family natural product biosynthesis protein [Streptomyces lunalinharesii]|uniref:Uncharacterized protein n=1 Tax=Streptomyces lunalinharesii TaxID=333384 RepID=A0ABN3SBG4_9ACTN
MDARVDSVVILADHLREHGVTATEADKKTLTVGNPLNSAVSENVTAVSGRYVTTYGYEVGEVGDEKATASRVAFLVGASSQPQPLLIDSDTIADTIRRALGFGSIRPSREELAATDEVLRGHVALLLAEARQSAVPQPPDRYRLDRISKHMAFPLGKGLLSADAEVHQRARDCQWLLAHFTAGRDEYKPRHGAARTTPAAGRRA